MSSELITSLLLGFVLGLYGGVVIARHSRFAELRNEVLRVIHSIDFIQEQNGVAITNADDVPKLTLVVSDLLFLKHSKAADVVSAIRSDIDEISIHSKAGRLKVSAFEQNYLTWQDMARNLPTNKLVLWSPWSAAE